MTKSEQLRQLIETIVRKEVRAILPQVVKEVMANLIMEATTSDVATEGYDNSAKRRQLLEQTRQETMSSMVGWDEEDGPPSFGENAVRGNGRNTGVNIVESRINENGNVIPIDPSQIPKNVLAAMNRDYSGVMASWSKIKK
jgi:hypothetical protein